MTSRSLLSECDDGARSSQRRAFSASRSVEFWDRKARNLGIQLCGDDALGTLDNDLPRGYRRPMVDDLLADLLRELPAVLLIGPRATGKTTTALDHAAIAVRLDHEAEAVRQVLAQAFRRAKARESLAQASPGLQAPTARPRSPRSTALHNCAAIGPAP